MCCLQKIKGFLWINNAFCNSYVWAGWRYILQNNFRFKQRCIHCPKDTAIIAQREKSIGTLQTCESQWKIICLNDKEGIIIKLLMINKLIIASVFGSLLMISVRIAFSACTELLSDGSGLLWERRSWEELPLAALLSSCQTPSQLSLCIYC